MIDMIDEIKEIDRALRSLSFQYGELRRRLSEVDKEFMALQRRKWDLERQLIGTKKRAPQVSKEELTDKLPVTAMFDLLDRASAEEQIRLLEDITGQAVDEE